LIGLISGFVVFKRFPDRAAFDDPFAVLVGQGTVLGMEQRQKAPYRSAIAAVCAGVEPVRDDVIPEFLERPAAAGTSSVVVGCHSRGKPARSNRSRR
jgi:hypothetical protein